MKLFASYTVSSLSASSIILNRVLSYYRFNVNRDWMVMSFDVSFLVGKSTLSSVGLKTLPLNTMGAPWIVYGNSGGHMSKSTVIDTFWHRYQRVAILAAFGTKWMLGFASFN